MALLFSACNSKLDTTTRTGSAEPAEVAPEEQKTDGSGESDTSTIDGETPAAAKLKDPDCVDPNLDFLKKGIKITLCNGQIAEGRLQVDVAALADCSVDGAVGCIANASFRAADMSVVTQGNIKNAVTIAGVAGNVVASPANCSSDGAVGCITTNTYKSANTSAFAATDLRDSVQVAGVTGSLASCTSDGALGCITNTSYRSADMAVALQGNIKSAVTIAGITGNVVAAPANCSADGQTNCVAVASYPAADSANLIGANIKRNVQIGGVTGTKRDVKQCRNAADLTTWDTAFAANIPEGNIPAAAVNVAGNTISVSTDHALATGAAVKISSTGTVPAPLVAGTTYYVIYVSASQIKLATSSANATGGTAIDLTSQGTGTHMLSPAGDVLAGFWDSIDDNNNDKVGAAETSIWGASYVCSDDNFTNVSGSTANLTPPNTIPSNATAAFSQIWEDALSGLYLTNVLYDGTTSTTWAKAFGICQNLDSGDGTNKWRLPTQKEGLQLYTDGLSKVAFAGNAGLNFWTSTTVSYSTEYVWTVQTTYGIASSYSRTTASNGVICVR